MRVIVCLGGMHLLVLLTVAHHGKVEHTSCKSLWTKVSTKLVQCNMNTITCILYKADNKLHKKQSARQSVYTFQTVHLIGNANVRRIKYSPGETTLTCAQLIQ